MAKIKNMEELKVKIAKVQNKMTQPLPPPAPQSQRPLSAPPPYRPAGVVQSNDALPQMPPLASQPAPSAQVQSSDMDALQREFEERKRQIEEQQLAMQQAQSMREDEPRQDAQDANEQVLAAIEQFHNDGKFRVELLGQLFLLNQTMSSIDGKLSQLLGTSE